MKKLLLVLILTPLILFSQDYNTWSVEPGYSLTKIRDVTSVEHGSFNLGVRKMFNTKFGAKINYSYTNSIENFHSGYLQGVLNVGRLLEFEKIYNYPKAKYSDFFRSYTILLSVGGHYSYYNNESNSNILHRNSNFHLAGEIENLIKISDKSSVSLGLNVITGVNSRPFNPGSTETTSIINFNAKYIIYLGKKKEHADWYLEPKEPKEDYVLNKNNYITYNIDNNCNCSSNEYVFFDNDSYMIDKDQLNAIMKIYNYMELNPESTLLIKAYASNTQNTTESYDLNLSKTRSAVIHDKLISLGIKLERIEFKFYGKDYTKDFKNHDIARRVELIIN